MTLPRDPHVAEMLRSYALGAVDPNLKEMLLRMASAYDAETARLDLLKTTDPDDGTAAARSAN